MIVNLYAIFDRASGIYDGPAPGQSDAVVIRQFRGMALNADAPIGKNPDDYTLFTVGKWNDATGEVIPATPEKLINGAEVIAQSRNINGEEH